MGHKTKRKRHCRFCGKLLKDNYFFCNESCEMMFREEYEDVESEMGESDAWKKYYIAV